MPATRKILGQATPSAGGTATLYSCNAGSTGVIDAVISTITVCNVAGSASTYRIHARIGGAAAAGTNAIAYDITIPGNTTDTWTIGITLAAGDIITVQSNTANLAFTAFGQETS